MFILITLTQHVSGIIMPIIRRTDYVNNCLWSMPGCVGCSRAELGHELCALCESWYTTAVCRLQKIRRRECEESMIQTLAIMQG